MLVWSKASGFRPGLDNPVEGLKTVLPRHTDDQKHHPALAYAQVPTFVQDLRATGAADATKLAFEFLILTAARTSDRGAMMAGFAAKSLRILGVALLLLGGWSYLNGAPTGGTIVAVAGLVLVGVSVAAARIAKATIRQVEKSQTPRFNCQRN